MSSTIENVGDSTLTSPVQIINEAVAIEQELIDNRRWFHAHPEIMFKEFMTAAKIVELLRSYGITEIFEGVGVSRNGHIVTPSRRCCIILHLAQ